MATTVSIQGYEGSFHQMAALKYFGKEVSILPCSTFRDVVKLAADPIKTNGGVMAIENSIAGSILPNYNLLQHSDLQIVGEIYLHISQNLLANKDITLADIREVHSHPMALLQCIDFLELHNWKLVETEDTALSAKHIYQHHSRHIAAIAGKLAADLYHLDVLAPDIQTQKNNYTRFLILQLRDENKKNEKVDKASITFRTDHAQGSLSKVLSIIADHHINLSKLQSMPIPDSAWQYMFYADMEFDSVSTFEEVIDLMRSKTQSLKILGIYKNGNQKSDYQ
jgi:prephenate dehydratase